MLAPEEAFFHIEEDDTLRAYDWNALSLPNAKACWRVAWAILDQGGFMARFSISAKSFLNFLIEIEYRYNKN